MGTAKPCLTVSITAVAMLASCGLEPVRELPPTGGAMPAGGVELRSNVDPRVERARWGAAPEVASSPRLEEQLARASHEVDARDSKTRDADIWSLMRIGGDPAQALGLELLDGGYKGTQHAAIGVAGEVDDEVRRDTLEQALWSRYALARDASEAEGLAFALARAGGRRSVARLFAELRSDDGPLRERDGAKLWTALAMMCARGVQISEDAREGMVAGLQSPFASRRREGARAIARCLASSAEVFGDKETRSVIGARLTEMTLASDQGEARMAWKALAALGHVESVAAAELSWEPSRVERWLVDLEMVRALSTQDDGRAALMAWVEKLDALPADERTVHVVRSILGELLAHAETMEGLVEFVKSRLAAWTLEGASSESSSRARKIQALLRCDLAALEAVGSRDLGLYEACVVEGTSQIPTTMERLRVDMLSKISSITEGKQGATELVQLAKSTEPMRAALALSALAELEHPAVNATLREALERSDVGVLAAAAAALASRSMDTRLRDPLAIAPLAKVVSHRAEVQALEGRLAAIEALGRLVTAEKKAEKTAEKKAEKMAENDASTELTPAHERLLREVVLPLAGHGNVTVRRSARNVLSAHPAFRGELTAMLPLPASSPPAPELRALLSPTNPQARGLRVETEAGSFVVDFRGVDAPINQLHLAKLARDGFYAGLRWHRIVPGFVVQGGDPRGDGYGGPGYLVPCEYSNITYGRGAVGIATAGRDTGGSQLFVTHAPTPHLDGRYSLVGFVAPEELHVVERILPDDHILAVTAVTDADGPEPR